MKTTPLRFADYLRWLLFTLAGGVLITVAFVMLVDPYGLYGFVRRDGFNSVKPGLTRYQDEIKLTHALALHASSVIVGNSRAEIGFDPDVPAISKRNPAAYNLAIPGIGIGTSRRQLEYLQQAGIKLQTIVVGLEFLDFVVKPDKARLTLPTTSTSAALHPIYGKFWRFDSLFSLASVKDAIRTLAIQHDDEAITISPKGFNPLKEYRAFARNDGYDSMFRQRAQENARNYLKKAAGSLMPADFGHLRAMLDMAAKDDTELKLIIYPYHAQIMVLFEEAGLWSAFEEWKSRLVAEVASARKRHPAARFTLLDFSGFGPYNCERIPSRTERHAATRWYWEAGHFKKELGDIVLSKVMAPTSAVPDLTVGVSNAKGVFGMPLDDSTRILNQLRIAAERSDCKSAYPELFIDAKAMVAKARDLEK